MELEGREIFGCDKDGKIWIKADPGLNLAPSLEAV